MSENPLLARFLTLARRGSHRGAAAREFAALRLVYAILDDVPRLDPVAQAGAIAFSEMAARSQSAARILWEVYRESKP